MKFNSTIIAITAMMLNTLAASASTPAEVAEIILGASLQTGIEQLSLETTKANIRTEGNLPDPELEGDYLVAPKGETNRWGAGVTWGLEWPGVYSMRKKESRVKQSAAEAAAEVSRRTRLLEIKKLLLDYVLAQRELSLLSSIKESNDTLVVLSGKMRDRGEMTRLDVNKLKLENATLTGKLESTRIARDEAIGALNVIYGGDCSGLLDGMDCEFPTLTAAEISKAMRSPEIALAKSETEIAAAALKTVSSEALPGITVGYTHEFEDGMHFNGASLGVSIPIFSQKGKKNAAKAALAEARLKEESAEHAVRQQVEGALSRLKIQTRQISDMQTIVEEEDNELALQKAYEGGVITLPEYITERNYFVNARLELESLRHSAAILMLDIERHM